jgi:hypothetical protein
LIRLKRYLEKCFIKYIDILVANTEYLHEELKKTYSQNKNKSFILYPTVDTIFYDELNSYYKRNDKSQVNLFAYSRWVK